MFRGTAIAQVIAVLGAVLLAKIYGEEGYGLFGVFISITSITSIISTFQLDKCIVISKNEKESANWFNFLLILIPVISLLITLILILFSDFFLKKIVDFNIFLFSAVGTLLLCYNLINESLFTFQKRFTIISNSKIFLTISNVCLQIILYTYFSLTGLIIGFLSSQFLLMLFFFFKNRKVINKPDFKEIKVGIKKRSTILKYLLPSNTINSLANNLMPILILAFFGAKETGVYFFSIKILATPLFLISSSISQVYFQKSAELLKENKKALLKLTKKIVITNLLIMFAFLLIINTIGMYLLEYFFSEKWLNLRIFTLVLSILIFARTAFNPISSLIVVLNKNFESLLFNSYLFLINLIAIYFGYIYDDILITITILSFLGGLGYLTLLIYFLNHLKYLIKKDV